MFNSFEVISVDSNLKLLHSLHNLKSLSGDYFEPVLSDVIGKSLDYFNWLSKGKGRGKIKWQFCVGLFKLSCKYRM